MVDYQALQFLTKTTKFIFEYILIRALNAQGYNGQYYRPKSKTQSPHGVFRLQRQPHKVCRTYQHSEEKHSETIRINKK